MKTAIMTSYDDFTMKPFSWICEDLRSVEMAYLLVLEAGLAAVMLVVVWPR